MKKKKSPERAPASATDPRVDAYIRNDGKWGEELKKLRAIILDSPLTEEFKWGVPCYSHQGHNVVIMHVFKEYCAILFVKGALLKDPKRVLVQQTENTQAARQIRFTNVREIAPLKTVLKSYIQEAVEVEKAGLKVKFKKTTEFAVPEEFKKKLGENPALKSAFQALTPGRQRAYLLHFSSAKQAQTRESRIERYVQRILDGKGLDD